MKAWCHSVFLITFIHMHTKQTLAFSTISCYSKDLGSLWQQSPRLVCDGFSQSLCVGILSATLYLPVSFLFLGVNLYLGHQNKHADWPFPKWFPVLFLMPVTLHLVSLFRSSTSSPVLCPSWSSLGLLVVEASGLSEQIVCGNTLHCS